VEEFKKAYKNNDVKALRRYIKSDRILSTHKFMTYVEKSFSINRDVYDVLVLILFNKYDFNKAIANLIKRDNVDLLEDILNTDIPKQNKPKLDKDLIYDTVPNGRISMAKAIYEYIYGLSDTYSIILKLLTNYNFKFVSDENDNTIDSFILALKAQEYEDVIRIIPYINLGIWDSFIVKFVVDYGNIDILRQILCDNTIDPGVDDNLAFKTAVYGGWNDMANELLKHPLVSITYIDHDFMCYVIEKNLLCVAKKILQEYDIEKIKYFKKYERELLRGNNDVTYLAIKLGIITGLHIDQRYLEKFEMDDHYIAVPYEFNLDPRQICELAFEEDDIDLAKKITNYSISIKLKTVLKLLKKYKNTDVYNYILNNKLKQYDPTDLIICAIYNIDTKSDKKLFEFVFNLAKDTPNIDYESLYKRFSYMSARKYILKEIELKYSDKNYKKFCLENGINLV
jgi:hypothetical protein